jgi:hypothetical protein
MKDLYLLCRQGGGGGGGGEEEEEEGISDTRYLWDWVPSQPTVFSNMKLYSQKFKLYKWGSSGL